MTDTHDLVVSAEGHPELILEDMDYDGVDVAVMHPNLSLFGLYSDDHELSMAHARVYNDYVIERFSPYFDRLAPTAPVPITDLDPVWAALQANGLQPFFHTQTGGVRVDDPESTTLKVVLENAAQVNQPMT